jgi:hypothetical protein
MSAVPQVGGGLTIGEGATIGGDLEYTSPEVTEVPPGTVEGAVRHTLEVSDEGRTESTLAQRVANWSMRNLRRLIALVVVGLLIAWLVPALLGRAADGLAERPWPALGLGAATFFGFPLAVLTVMVVVFLVALVLFMLTLGNLGGSLLWIGLSVVLLLSVAFGLAVAYVAKIVVAHWGGRLLLRSINPAWGQKPIWSTLLGVLIVAILLAVPFVGWLFGLAITLFGLGTLWFLGRGQAGLTGEDTMVVKTEV